MKVKGHKKQNKWEMLVRILIPDTPMMQYLLAIRKLEKSNTDTI